MAMSGTIDFSHAAKRLGRSVGKSSCSIASIARVERVLDQATQLQVEAKANIGNVILILEESATRLRWITSMFDQRTAVSIAFGNRLAEIEQLLKIVHDKAADL
jgi:hypothetical protein